MRQEVDSADDLKSPVILHPPNALDPDVEFAAPFVHRALLDLRDLADLPFVSTTAYAHPTADRHLVTDVHSSSINLANESEPRIHPDVKNAAKVFADSLTSAARARTDPYILDMCGAGLDKEHLQLALKDSSALFAEQAVLLRDQDGRVGTIINFNGIASDASDQLQ